MKTLLIAAAYLLVLFGAVSWIAVWRQRVGRKRTEELAAREPWFYPGTPEYIERFANPEFRVIEARLGRPLPASLVAFYERPEHAEAERLFVESPDGVSFDVARFLPLDERAFENHRYGLRPTELAVATAFDGSFYFLAIDQGDAFDAPLYRAEDGGDRRSAVAPGFGSFMSWPRRPEAPAQPAP